MKWWPWRRRLRTNGEARQAIRDAQDQHQAAQDISSQADRTAAAAGELARRTDRFAREVERSMRLKRGPA